MAKNWSSLVPSGGTTGQVLDKASNANGDTAWATVSGGGSLTSVSASLATDFALSGTAYQTPTGCTLSLTAGTWLIFAMAGIDPGSGTPNVFMRLFDGTIPIAAAEYNDSSIGVQYTWALSLSARYVAAGAVTLSLQARQDSSGASVLSAVDGLAAGTATHLFAVKIA